MGDPNANRAPVTPKMTEPAYRNFPATLQINSTNMEPSEQRIVKRPEHPNEGPTKMPPVARTPMPKQSPNMGLFESRLMEIGINLDNAKTLMARAKIIQRPVAVQSENN